MERQTKHFYEFGPFRIDPLRRLLLRDQRPLPLTPKAFDILVVLVENNDRALDKDELMRMVWPDTVVEENNLTRNISTLRKVLGETPDQHQFIVTMPGQGYRFVADVRDLAAGGLELVIEKRTKAEIIVEDDEAAAAFEARTQRQSVAEKSQRQQRFKLAVATLVIVSLVVALGAALFYFRPPRRANVTAPGLVGKSIAVLPFRSVGDTGDDAYLRLGMADALITRLSNAREITVRPTSAIAKYAEQASDPRDVGQSLGVDTVLEGNFQRANDRVRVTVQLVSVADGRSLWAAKFDEKWTDIFAVQDAISEQVAQALTLRLTGEERGRLTKRYTANTDAYQLYLWGRYFWNKRTAEGFKKAIDYFEQAIAKDSNYALAFAGLADCYNLLSSYYMLPQREAYPKAKATAMKALEIDETLAEAHASLAYVTVNYEWDWSGAEREYKRALELNPNYASAHQWYAWELLLQGRFAEATGEMNRARELDPLSLAINTDIGLHYYYMHHFDQAIQQYQKVLEMDPQSAQLHSYMASAYVYDGRYQEALAEQEKWAAFSDGSAELQAKRREQVSEMKRAFAVGGERGAWRKSLEIARAAPGNGPAGIAAFYAVLGEKDRALQLLEKSYVEREELMLYLKVDPGYDNLRSDPRFDNLVRRVGLNP